MPPPISDGLYANCDGSTGMPLLTIEDMLCFNAKFAQGDMDANCDGNGVLNVADGTCFNAVFAAGCTYP